MVQLLKITITTDYPLWFSIFCLILGFLYAFFLYRKDDKLKDSSIWVMRIMAISRFLLVSILAFLLLSPFIKTVFNEEEKPIIIIAHDNSSSVLLNKDSTFYRQQYLQQLNELKNNLKQNYEVKSYVFGDQFEEGDQIKYDQKITDISNVFYELNNKYYNRNVGALIIASDGIFNQGANPLYTSKVEFPVYTIALGDTSMQKDLILNDPIHNKITFVGNKFPIEVNFEALQCKSENTTLTVVHDGKELYNKSFDVKDNYLIIDEKLMFEAKKPGVQHYKIKLSSIEGEISYVNNEKDIYIEVIDGRQEILLLGNAPHPDIKALRLSIENNENYKVTTQMIKDFDKNLDPYSLVIAHQLTPDMAANLSTILDSKISLLMILGNQTNINQFNGLNTGLKISNSRGKTSEILPSVEQNFPLFSLSETTINALKQMPPVIGPFGSYQLNTNSYTLLSQKIGSINTETPLFIFFNENGKKRAIFTAEGIWKWSMQDYVNNNNHDAFNELINKTVQFLSLKEDKSKFRVSVKNEFLENEEVQFISELYNENYELVNTPEVTLNIVEESGKKYNYTFNKTANAYILNAGILPYGFYNYQAKVTYAGKDYSSTGKFQVKPILLEANNTVANHQLMQSLAEKMTGKMFYPNEVNQIGKTIRKNADITSIIYEEKNLKELIQLKWIFIVLMVLLTLEWFLRKRNGAY